MVSPRMRCHTEPETTDYDLCSPNCSPPTQDQVRSELESAILSTLGSIQGTRKQRVSLNAMSGRDVQLALVETCTTCLYVAPRPWKLNIMHYVESSGERYLGVPKKMRRRPISYVLRICAPYVTSLNRQKRWFQGTHVNDGSGFPLQNTQAAEPM